jgi:hypothetical protein
LTLCTIFLILATLPLVPGDNGPRGEEKPALQVGGYQLSGTVSVGYRFVEIDHGQDELYREVIGLDNGMRLFDFTLRGQHTAAEPTLLDRFTLEAVNIGDPYPKLRLKLVKDGAYAFEAAFRNSEFFVDRTDDAFSANRDVNVEQRFGDINLTLFPARPLQVQLFFHGMRRDGTGTAPRLIENNVFVLRHKPDETTSEFGAVVDLSTRALDLHLEQSYRRFSDDGRLVLPAGGLAGLRSDTPFLAMRLTGFRESRDQEVDTLLTRLRLRSSVTERWEITGGYVFAHSTGSSHLDAEESGIGRAGTAGPNEAFSATLSGDGEVRRNLHIVELGTSYALLSNVIMHLDYRFHLVDQNGQGVLQTRRIGALTGLTILPIDGRQVIKTWAHTLTTEAEWLPLATLTLRLGYRYQWRDVEVDQLANGMAVLDDPLAAAPQLDRTTQGHGLIFSADWRYRQLLHVSVRFVGDYFDNPYTRIDPAADHRLRAQVRLTPLKWLSVSETFALTDLDNPDTGTSTQSRSWTTGLFLHPIEPLTFEGSVTYEELDHQSDTLIPIDAVRTPTTFINDSELLSYTVTGTLDLPPHWRARAYASWTRVFGEGTLSYFYPGGEVSYHWEKPDVWLTSRYERPYVIEREPPFDEFFAHIATLVVTKSF